MLTTGATNTIEIAAKNIPELNNGYGDIDFVDEVFQEDSDFNSDSTGMRGGSPKYL